MRKEAVVDADVMSVMQQLFYVIGNSFLLHKNAPQGARKEKQDEIR